MANGLWPAHCVRSNEVRRPKSVIAGMLLPGFLSRMGEGQGEGDQNAITDFVCQTSLGSELTQ